MQVKFLTCDNWQGLYINDILVLDGHRIETRYALKEIAKHWKEGCRMFVKLYTVNDSWIEDVGYLYDGFDDIPKKELEFIEEIIF